MAPPDLDAFQADPSAAGLFLDFDGSLSEIAATPEDARAVEGLGPVLERLTARYRVVAVVSGRPGLQVAGLVDAPVRVFGLYGLEDERGSAEGAERLRATVDAAMADIRRAARYVPGSRVEPKGLSAAVHYREAEDPEPARRVLLERLAAVAERHDLEMIEGKRVVELAAGPRPDKGEVIRRVSMEERLRRVLFAGDDLADLEGFAAVDDLATAGLEGVKVAVRSPETPPSLVERADLVVEGPEGLLELLSSLAP